MQTVAFYTVALAFVFGVFLRSFVSVPLPIGLLLLLIAGGLFVLCWRTKIYQTKLVHSPATLVVLLAISLGLIAMLAGVWRMDGAQQSLSERASSLATNETTTITGRVIREPDVRDTATLLTVEAEGTRVLVRVDRYTDISYGDTIEVTGKLEAPEPFVTDLGREFDYLGYLSARGITHTMSFVTPIIIERDESSFWARLYAGKRYFLDRLALVLPPPAYGLGAGLLLGVQSALGEQLMADFRAAGIVHIVVLSGYNIMLVVAFVLYLTAFLLPFRLRLLVAGGAIILFAFLVGYAPSVLRATVMALLFLLSALLARPYDILRVLVLAGVLMILVNPFILRFDIGFQLSFMATLGLVLLAPQFELMFTKVTAWFSLRTFLVATIATQLAVLPLILYHSGEWSMIAVPVNLLVLPMVAVAMLLTFLTGLLALVSLTLATPLALLAELSLMYIISVATYASKLPFATIEVSAFSGYLVPVAYLLLAVMWYMWRQYQIKKSLTGGGLSKAEVAALGEWEIVEESVLLSTLPTSKTKPSEPVVPAQKVTPIFFR